MKASPSHRTVWLPALALALTACGHKPLAEREPKSFEEAGSVEVAVLSVTKWELLIKALDPNFQLTGEQALTKAIATTRQTQEQTLSVTQAMLAAALGGNSTTSENKNTTKSSGGATTSDSESTSTTKRAPGDISQVSAATLPDSPTAAKNPDALALGQDSITQYQMATALLQEVQLLNKYVKDAPEFDGYEPFVVRLQVSVRPKGRNVPVDANVNISFLHKDLARSGVPIAVPMLVTDNLEATSAFDFRHQISQLGIALGALKGNNSFLGSYGRTKEESAQAVGWQYHSQLMLGRPTMNSISVRISATPVGLDRFDLVPKTRNLTILLLVKRNKPTKEEAADPKKVGSKYLRSELIRYTSRAEFSMAGSGAVLPSKPTTNMVARAAEVLKRNSAPSICQQQVLEILNAIWFPGGDAGKGEVGACLTALEKSSSIASGIVWAELSAIASDGPFASGEFQATFFPEPQYPSGTMTVPLVISGKKEPYSANMTLNGGKNLVEYHVSGGSLTFGDEVKLVASDTSIVNSRSGVKLTFENIPESVLTKLKSTGPDGKPVIPPVIGLVELRDEEGATKPLITITGGVIRSKPEPPTTSTDVKAGTQASVNSKLETVVTLGVEFPKLDADGMRPFSSVALEPIGGMPAAITRISGKPACARVEASKIVVTGDCNFDVLLRNVRIPEPADCCEAAPSALKFKLIERRANLSVYADGDGPTVRLTSEHRRPEAAKVSITAK
jgi:hypothetical protein